MEIKFRAWNEASERFVYSDQIAGGMWRYFKTLEDMGIRHFQSQQYTNCNDKNNKDIYWGDIMSRFWKDCEERKLENRYLVCFGLYDNGCAYDEWKGGNGWYLANEMFFRSDVRERKWESKCEHFLNVNLLEVIGNIKENPELLETEEIRDE